MEPIKTAITVFLVRFLGGICDRARVKYPMKIEGKQQNVRGEFLRPKIKRVHAAADRVSSGTAVSALPRCGILKWLSSLWLLHRRY